MSDGPKIVPGRVAILDEKGEPRERKKPRNPMNRMDDYVTRQDMADGLASASLAVGQKMYDQMIEETIAEFEAFEQRCFARIDAYLYRHSWRGRRDRVVAWVKGVLTELGVLSPVPGVRLVDPVEALDPNVPAAARADDDLSDLPEDEIIEEARDVR